MCPLLGVRSLPSHALSSRPPPPLSQVGPAGWAGVQYPNASTASHDICYEVDCGATGCLFDVVADPGEYNDLAAQRPDDLARLNARLDVLKQGIWANNERGVDACPANVTELCACWMASHVYGGFLGAC